MGAYESEITHKSAVTAITSMTWTLLNKKLWHNKMHALAQEQNKTCIDCHKGIAHNLPHMEKVQQSFIPADMLKANEKPADNKDAK